MARFIQYLISRNLEGKALTDEMIRDFKRIVLPVPINHSTINLSDPGLSR